MRGREGERHTRKGKDSGVLRPEHLLILPIITLTTRDFLPRLWFLRLLATALHPYLHSTCQHNTITMELCPVNCTQSSPSALG